MYTGEEMMAERLYGKVYVAVPLRWMNRKYAAAIEFSPLRMGVVPAEIGPEVRNLRK